MLRYRAPPPSVALGMVSPLLSSSSSSSSFSSNPNLITFNPSFPVLKPSPTLPSLLSSFHQKPTRSMTHSKCFSGPSPAVPIPTACEVQEVDSVSLVVVSFYKFADFPDHAEFRSPLKKLCQELVLVLSCLVFWLKFVFVLIWFVSWLELYMVWLSLGSGNDIGVFVSDLWSWRGNVSFVKWQIWN